MGCGKTYWGRQLGKQLQLPFFDLDTVIEEKEEKTITAIFEQEGEERFRLLEKEVLHLLTESHASFVMATGGGTPCYYKNIDYMKSMGIVVWINCSVDCLHGRLLRQKAKRPLIKDLDDDQLRSFIVKKMADRKIYYQQAHISFSDDQIKLDQLISKIFHT